MLDYAPTLKQRTIKIEQFEGPLDLLLQLIEQEKLEITKVALAEVTEQYITTLRQSGDVIPAHELADFLVIAARLLLIKSRALLPFLVWEEDEEDGSALTQQLRMYKEYIEAMKALQGMLHKHHVSFAREKLLTVDAPRFQPPASVTADMLRATLEHLLRGMQKTLDLPSEVVKKTISIEEKIQEIRAKVFTAATTRFSEVLKVAKDRTEVIVSFLALLELMKQRIIRVNQDETFADIVIEKV